MQIVFEDTLREEDIETEDYGHAKIVGVYGTLEEDCLFVKIQSWDDFKEHQMFKSLIGKKVRVTIEVID